MRQKANVMGHIVERCIGSASLYGLVLNVFLAFIPAFAGTVPEPGSSAFAPAFSINVKDHQWAGGAKCDFDVATNSGTDDTAAFTAAIAAAETSTAEGVGTAVELPPSGCVVRPLVVTGQIAIIGQSAFSSALVLKSGSNAALFSVSTKGDDFPRLGYANGLMYFKNFRITSQDGADTNAKHPEAAAFSFSVGVYPYWVYMYDMVIYNVPGDGVTGVGPFGFLSINNSYLKGNGGYCVSTNSTIDNVFNGLNLDGCYKDNLLSSGDSSLYIHNLNSYASRGHGIHLYGVETVTCDGHNEFNLNAYSGLYVAALAKSAVVDCANVTFGQNSRAAAAKWPAVSVVGGAGIVHLPHANFASPFPVNKNNTEQANVNFDGGAITMVYCEFCTLQAGPVTTSGVTNNTSQFLYLAAGGNILSDPFKVSTLPSAPPLGTRAYVTDAASCGARLGVVKDGGSTFCPVIWSGSKWEQD